MNSAARYPRAKALLDRMIAARGRASPPEIPAAGFTLGPAVLRAPPELALPAPARARAQPLLAARDDDSTQELLGELVDMVFVGADEEGAHGHPEVHLMFKAEVLGGLHLRLVKMPDGMHATFVVEDAAARRAVIDHVDGLVAHLKGRGFAIASHKVELPP